MDKSSISDIRQDLDNYKDRCEMIGDIPSMAGFAVEMDLLDVDDLLSKYDDRTIRYIRNFIYNIQFQMAAKGDLDRQIFLHSSINDHGRVSSKSSDKKSAKADIKVNGDVRGLSMDDLMRIASEGLG